MTPKPGAQTNLPLGVQIVFDAINKESTAAQARAQILSKALADQNLGTDPNYVVSGEHYEDYNHQQLYDFAQAINTEGLQSARDLWNTQGTKISTLASEAVAKVLTRTAYGAWVGASGDALRAAVAALEKTGIQLGGVCTTVGVRLEAASYAAEATRIAVPAPEPSSKPDPDDPNSSVIPGVANPATLDTEQAAQNQAELAAQAAFNNIYRPGVWTSGDQVPAFTEVAKVGQDGGANGGPGGGPDGSAGGPSADLPESIEPSSPQDPTDPSQSDDPGSGGDQSDSDDSSTSGSTSDESSSGDNSGTTNQPDSEETTVAATTTQPGQTTGTPLAGSPGTGGALGGSAGGAPGSGIPGAPIAGKSVAGPGIAQLSGVAPGGGAAAARSPMMPMGGMPGAAGRGKDDETNRKSPEYLRSVSPEWTDGLKAYPGVYGADANAAMPSNPPTTEEPSRTTSVPPTEPANGHPNTQPTPAADSPARTAPISASPSAAPVESANPPAAEPEVPQPQVSATDVSGLLRQFSAQGPFGPTEPSRLPESESPAAGPPSPERLR